MRGLDLIDIALHIAAAAVVTAACAVLGHVVDGLGWLGPAAVASNVVFWPVREAVQRAAVYAPWLPWQWSAQKHLEAWPPGLAAAGMLAWLG